MVTRAIRELLRDEWHADYAKGSPVYELLAHAEDPGNAVRDTLLQHEPRLRELTVFEFGCGPGDQTRRYAGTGRWLAADLYPAQVARARESSGDAIHAEFAVADVTAVPLADNSVDVAFGAHVFGALPSDEQRDAAMSELCRVVRPRGRIWLLAGVGGELNELAGGHAALPASLEAELRRRTQRWALRPIAFVDSSVRFPDVATALTVCSYFWGAAAADAWFATHESPEFSYRYMLSRATVGA